MMRVALLWAAFTQCNGLVIEHPPNEKLDEGSQLGQTGHMMSKAFTTAASSNFITDGDFEDAVSAWDGTTCPWNDIKPTGWNVASFEGDYLITSGTGNCDGRDQLARAGSGTFFVQLHSQDQFFQDVSGLAVGVVVTLSFWATTRPDMGDGYVMVKVDDVEIGNTGNIPDCVSRAASCWAFHEFTFTTTAATAKIGFQSCREDRNGVTGIHLGCSASTGSESSSPFIDDIMLMAAATPEPTAVPTPQPTKAPTPYPTPAPPATANNAGGTAPTSAKGDPHLRNINGERFDLMRPGRHVLLHIPRGADVPHVMLRVEAEVQRLGTQCGDMYFQHLNITGAWVEAKHKGILQFQAGETGGEEEPAWMAFGAVYLKVVRAHGQGGIHYLNLFAKHLGQTGFTVGGLLGEDDHTYEATPDPDCKPTLSLHGTKMESESIRPSAHAASSAEASLA